MAIEQDRWLAAVHVPVTEQHARVRAAALQAATQLSVASNTQATAQAEVGSTGARSEAVSDFDRLHVTLTPPATPHGPPMPQDLPAMPNDDDDVSDDEVVITDEPDDIFAPQYDDVEVAPPTVNLLPFKKITADFTDTALREAVERFEPPGVPPPAGALYRDSKSGFTRINVASSAMEALRGRKKVNEEIVYAGIASLVEEHAAHNANYALFQPYDYTMWTNQKQRARVFNSVQATSFWSKNVILVPIHDEEHWVLAIAYPKYSKIDFFDSLGLRTYHKEHAKNVAHLLSSLLQLARGRGFKDVWPAPIAWDSRPLVDMVAPFQRGAVDCGLWVLAIVAASIRGFRTTALREEDMPNFRLYLSCLIRKHIPPVIPRQ
ncbi:cysteine proteinase [Auricularia subglabra TFB-10046 SS5]|uniref:Cysteine proteinase n=1 Tax=Auricularia subglabra (strain TFB-10046 / SS5) TaxID=717982 RepID=J0WMN7_AURST|nr:cysteine proteinase [Auricularia subglabra TFB-10046 SS5]